MKKRILGALMTMCIMLTMLPTAVYGGEASDGAAFGIWMRDSMTAERMTAWQNDAVSADQMRQLLNRQALHPQATGWLELDALLGEMASSAGEGADTYTVLRYFYNWLVQNVTYSWAGYSYTSASVRAYNSVTGYNYLSSMTYQTWRPKSIPDDMANRTYHILKERKGVCYDYAIAVAVMARYLGIESYVQTGYFVFEAYVGSGHHGWAVLMLDGQPYIFDAQRDARNVEQNYGRNYYYFGIAPGKTWRYNASYDAAANKALEESMLPVTTVLADPVTISVSAIGPGSVSGGGSYVIGQQAQLRQTPMPGMTFVGWYNSEGILVSEEPVLRVSVTEDASYEARFIARVTAKASRGGTVSGGGDYDLGELVTLTARPQSRHTFEGWYDASGKLLGTERTLVLTPAENTAVIYAMFSGDRFADVEDSWYTQDVMDAAEAGYVSGTAPFLFEPERKITRAEMVTLLARLEGVTEPKLQEFPAAPFSDVSGHWAENYIGWAYAEGLVTGVSASKFAPGAAITRQETVVLFIRYLERIETCAEQDPDFEDAAEISDWAISGIGKAQSAGLIVDIPDDGDDLLRPRENITRAETVVMLMRLAGLTET